MWLNQKGEMLQEPQPLLEEGNWTENAALQNHILKEPLKGSRPAQSRSNVGQAAQAWPS